jgi:3' terminal RNA ribose 2'-O-methyltransferase Hen1
MLLSLTTTYQPATDLGYLLHKNPVRVNSFELAFGRGQVFFPEASVEKCTAALLVDVDPVKLVQGGRKGLRKYDYVNDRLFVASSHMSVAIAQVFGSALNGASRERPELALTAIPLEARLEVVRCRGGEPFLRKVFEPLGYSVDIETHTAADSAIQYFSVTLSRECRLQELLEHLYVLIPVLDDDKHYWVGEDEVDKLMRRAGDWLAGHPSKDQIVDRYLKHRTPLRQLALARLLEAEDEPVENDQVDVPAQEESLEVPLNLHIQRLQSVAEVLKARGARRILDLGCGEGRLISVLLGDGTVEEVVGVEVSLAALDRARQRLRLDRLTSRQAARVKLLHSSLTYRDRRLQNYDAAALVEVIEHLDPARLSALERVVFEQARPNCIVVTTPNCEYNARFGSLNPGEFRHPDHRFEWSRHEFQTWCATLSDRYGYTFTSRPIGPEDPDLGPPTQMAVFTL